MSPSQRPILIVEDHPVFVSGLRPILPPDRAVFTASTLRDAREQCAKLQPSVVLLDVELPDGDGVERLPDLRAAVPDAWFVVVSRHDSAAVVRAARENGADGFLQKGLSNEEFTESLRRSIIDEAPVWPEIEDATGVSKRQIHVLYTVAQFKSDKDAARALEISPETLRGHMKRIFKKLAVHNRVQAITKARSLKLIP